MRQILRLVAFILVSVPVMVGASGDSPRSPILGIAYVQLRVSDLEKSNDFYVRALGLSSVNCPAEGAKCYFISPGQNVELIKTGSGSVKNGIAAIGLYTKDARSLRSYLLSKGLQPGELITDATGMVYFRINDPENHALQFVQTRGIAGSVAPPALQGLKIIHAGFVVNNRTVMDKFYKDILGFRLYWSGGMNEGETSWVAMQVPDGTDWVEYMLNIPANADRHLLGVMNHISLGVPDVQAAARQLEAAGAKLTEQPKIGRDGKWQLNLYDPDFTRVELMGFTPVTKPCCSEFTGPHPLP